VRNYSDITSISDTKNVKLVKTIDTLSSEAVLQKYPFLSDQLLGDLSGLILTKDIVTVIQPLICGNSVAAAIITSARIQLP